MLCTLEFRILSYIIDCSLSERVMVVQLRATCQSVGRHGYTATAPAPGCELQDALMPALRNRLKPYEAIVTHLPLTSTMIEKFATDVRLSTPPNECFVSFSCL
jgi:hypothetical protein